MTTEEIRQELRQLSERKQELEGMLVAEILPKDGINACRATWRPDGACTYCGSMTPTEAIRRLSEPGNYFSGADWKYGWPHKFYIGAQYPHKFYNMHLKDATREEFAEFNALSEFYLGISWFMSEGELKYRAAPDTQLHGKTIARQEAAS